MPNDELANKQIDAIWSEDGDLLGISGAPFVIRGFSADLFTIASISELESLRDLQISSPAIPTLIV